VPPPWGTSNPGPVVRSGGPESPRCTGTQTTPRRRTCFGPRGDQEAAEFARQRHPYQCPVRRIHSAGSLCRHANGAPAVPTLRLPAIRTESLPDHTRA